MSEKVKKLGINRDYEHFLYYINAFGDVCKRDKLCGPEIVLYPLSIERDRGWLYYIDKDGDVARIARGRSR